MKNTCRLIILMLLATASLYGQQITPDESSIGLNPAGHLECRIQADTDCVSHQVTLGAFAYYLFSGLSEPVTVPWSTGVTAHKITVEPPGYWSWDASVIGCDHFFNFIEYPSPFFSGPIEIEGGENCCISGPIDLAVTTQGYNAFSSFQWNPQSPQLSPYQISAPGTYALTVTDALGCSFTDAVFIGSEVVCPNPPPNGAESCSTACIYCELDGLTGTNNGTPSGGNTVCGQIVVHNDQWYGFLAGSDTITLEVISSNCQIGDGLQLAIFSDCSDLDAIVCNPGCSGCGSEILTLSYTDFTPGESYWLMIDGWVSDVCDYEIRVVEGSATAPVPAPAGQIHGPTEICPGGTAVYAIDAVAGAGTYQWTVPTGSLVNGIPGTISLNSPQGTQVTVTFGAEAGLICVQAGNACHAPGAPSCLDVTLRPIPPTVKPDLFICQDDLPYQWDEAPFTTLTSAGTYTLNSTSYTSYFGCDSTIRQTITIGQPLVTDLPIQYLCPGECFEYEGSSYCDPGPQSVVLTSYQGCDSVVNFSLTYLNPIAEIQGPTEILCGQSAINLTSATSPGTKTWRDVSGAMLGNGDSLNVSQPGRYILTSEVSGGGVTCEQSDTVLVTIDPTVLLVQIEGATEGCGTDSLLLTCITSDENAQFLWSGPNGFTSIEQNPLVTALGEYSVAVVNATGCTGAATISVEMLGDFPDVTATGDIITCAHTLGQLNGSSSNVDNSFVWTGPDGFQSVEEDPSVSIPGEYILTVTSLLGCSTTASATIETQTESPAIEVPNTSILCTTYPQLQPITSATAPSYLWAGPNGFTSQLAQPEVTLAGFYMVTVTDGVTGCTNTAEALVLYDEPLLAIETDEVVQPSMGQSNGSISISIAGFPGAPIFSWFLNGTPLSNEEDIHNLAAGTYRVVVSDSFGCFNELTIVLMATSATTDLSDEDPWGVRPNPSTGHFEICCNDSERKATELVVYDYCGQRLFEQPVLETQSEIFINLSEVPCGVYFLEIRDGVQRKWMKLVVQR